MVWSQQSEGVAEAAGSWVPGAWVWGRPAYSSELGVSPLAQEASDAVAIRIPARAAGRRRAGWFMTWSP